LIRGGTAMHALSCDFVIPCEAERVFDYTINGGEALLMFGVDDFGQILSWVNLADLALELVPSCRESLHSCVDWYATNRERVEITLTILRDARSKVHDLRYAALLGPSKEHRMLIERVCGRRGPFGSSCHPSHPRSLSVTKASSEEQQ